MKFGGKFYDKNVLWKGLARPHNLQVFKTENILFFSYSIAEMFSEHDFQLATFNLEKNETHLIGEVPGGCAIAIDHENDDIYLGGSDGIYLYNSVTRSGEIFKEKGKNVWSLFHRNHLFYISYPEQKLHMAVDGKFSVVKEFKNFEVDVLHITSVGEIYFANKSGLYMFDSDNKHAIVINKLIVVRQITEDSKNNLYMVTNFGIYKGREWKKLSDANTIYSLAFDKDDNIIISDDRSIIKLIPSVIGCYRNVW